MSSSDPSAIPVAVVLAGGRSRRFGSDKLITELDGRTLLDRALDHLPTDWPVIIVGPSRAVSRPVRFVSEQPPGGGPGAGLVTGARAVLESPRPKSRTTIMVTLAGDAPEGGLAAVRLWQHAADLDLDAVVATDEAGQDQPLQLCVRGESLRRLAAVTESSNVRARDLLGLLDPLARLVLPERLTTDIDTPEQALLWRRANSPAPPAVS